MSDEQELAKAKKDKSQEELAGLLHCKQPVHPAAQASRRGGKPRCSNVWSSLTSRPTEAVLLKEQFATTYELREERRLRPAAEKNLNRGGPCSL